MVPLSPDQEERLAAADAWLALVLRAAAFIVGSVILLYELLNGGQRFYLIAAGGAGMGPVVAQGIATIVSAARGGAASEPPKPPE